jgi:hypothetical protein
MSGGGVQNPFRNEISFQKFRNKNEIEGGTFSLSR